MKHLTVQADLLNLGASQVPRPDILGDIELHLFNGAHEHLFGV